MAELSRMAALVFTSFTMLTAAAAAATTTTTSSSAFVTNPSTPHTISNGVIEMPASILSGGVLTTTITAGTPPQSFVVAVDSTYGVSWLTSSDCTDSNCQNRKTYYANPSSTSYSDNSNNMDLSYMQGEYIESITYVDTVSVSNITVPQLTFAGVKYMENFMSGFDGYLGLGKNVNFNSTSFPTKIHPRAAITPQGLSNSSSFLYSAAQSGLLAKAQFSLYTNVPPCDAYIQNATSTSNNKPSSSPTPANGGIGRYRRRSAAISNPDGYVILGGVDRSAFQGSLVTVNSLQGLDPNTSSWRTIINSISVGNLIAQQPGNTSVIFSTASQFISMPQVYADALHKLFTISYDSDNNMYPVNCTDINTLPTIVFSLDGMEAQLPPFYWTRVINQAKNQCATRIVRSTDVENGWVLGAPFTSAFYTMFDLDQGQVSFAIKKNQTNDGLQVTAIGS